MIAYLTHDEVNAELARRLARRLGSDLRVLPLKDVDHSGGAELLIIDLDHLPREGRSELFRRASSGALREGVAVHSYHLSGAEARALRAAGVRVARRLTASLLVTGGDAGPIAGSVQNAGSGIGSATL